MKGTKSLLLSKTFWGASLAIVGSLLGMLGYTFGPEEQQAVVEIATVIATNVGALIAMYGRIVATKAIG